MTVMFCDWVGSTDLAGKLDPEDRREVVRAYQETAVDVIQGYNVLTFSDTMSGTHGRKHVTSGNKVT